MNLREDIEFARSKEVLMVYVTDVIFPKIDRHQNVAGNDVVETFYPVVGYSKRFDAVGMEAFLEEQELKIPENRSVRKFNAIFA